MKLFEFQTDCVGCCAAAGGGVGWLGYLYPLSPGSALARGQIQERQSRVWNPPPDDNGFVMDFKCTFDNCRQSEAWPCRLDRSHGECSN